MNNLQNNADLTANSNNNETPSKNYKTNVLESGNPDNKIKENLSNTPVPKHKSNGKPLKEEEDLVEQDLSDVEDNYREPSVQRYLPGIFVDVNLKTNFLERKGRKIAIPMIVDFYSECLKKYGDEKNFIYEESYLENMKGKVEDFYPDLPKVSKGTGETPNDSQTQPNFDNKQVISGSEVQKTVNYDENLDDVIWLKNRPNDPLLRCIRSITDRLNIQGIVGDPTSYLKKGGDDMHYDMDDPFFDDSAMLSELKMSKSDILLKRAMEKEFSDWSEDEEDEEEYVEPEDFVADYYSSFQKDIKQQKEMESEYKLYFYPSGWRDYISKIPKRFHNIYSEFESQMEYTAEPITDKLLRVKVKELLESIFKRLLKLKILPKTPKYSSKSKKNKPEKELKLNNEVPNEENLSQTQPLPDENQQGTVEEDKAVSKPKTNPNEIPKEILKKRGLNCMLQYRIIDVNGKILRWIVKSVTAMTNAYSPFEIHCEWFALVVANNEKLLAEQSNKLKSKLTTKLQSLKPKKSENLISQLSESSKTLSKSIGIIRKLLKEHREATFVKASQSSKEVKEPVQRKSLIEISLDSARDDHYEYMGLSQPTTKQVPKVDELVKNDYESIVQFENLLLETMKDSQVSVDLDKKDAYELNFQEANMREENDETSSSSSSNTSTADNSSVSRLEDDPASGTPMPKSDQLTEFKENDLKDKNDQNSLADSGIKTPKRSSGQKDEDLDEILKQSKIMKRVKDVYNLFKLVGNESLAFVQMNNLAIYVANKMNNKEFKHVVEHLGLTQNPFDQTYRRLGEIGSKLVQELYNFKVSLPTDVMKVVVINLQTHLKVEELYEKKSKKPLLLFNNSKIKASPGKLFLTPPKPKTPRKTPKGDTNKNVKTINSEIGNGSKEVKPSPRKRKDPQNPQYKPTPIKTKEDGNKEIQEPEKKKKRTQSVSRVNSLKDFFLSRLR